MSIIRAKTRVVYVRELPVGSGHPISIQSMTNVPIENTEDSILQIRQLTEKGADLVRLAVRNEDSIQYLKKIRKAVNSPLSADIHFNYKIAVKAIEAGIDKVRINPGNIGDHRKVIEVVRAAKDHSVPIRIGVNSGSIDRNKYAAVTPENLVESAIDNIRILEDNDFFNIIVSIKSSDLFQTIEANKLFSTTRDYPLHIGLTEAGYGITCAVQSSIAIGHLLLNGIGDTLRVSMTGDPVEEVVIARKILETVGERILPVKIISCPTCGRTDSSINVLELAVLVEKELNARFSAILKEKNHPVTVAVMGCEVNGPGEASHADLGVAGGRGGALLLFAGGKKLRKIEKEDVCTALIEEVGKIVEKLD